MVEKELLEVINERLFNRSFTKKQLVGLLKGATTIQAKIDHKLFKRAVRAMAKEVKLERINLLVHNKEIGATIVVATFSFEGQLYKQNGASKCNYSAGDTFSEEMGKQISLNRARRNVAKSILKDNHELQQTWANLDSSLFLMGEVIDPHLGTIMAVRLRAREISAGQDDVTEGIIEAMKKAILRMSEEGQDGIPFTDSPEQAEEFSATVLH